MTLPDEEILACATGDEAMRLVRDDVYFNHVLRPLRESFEKGTLSAEQVAMYVKLMEGRIKAE